LLTILVLQIYCCCCDLAIFSSTGHAGHCTAGSSAALVRSCTAAA
jgi:hypothetical protein